MVDWKGVDHMIHKNLGHKRARRSPRVTYDRTETQEPAGILPTIPISSQGIFNVPQPHRQGVTREPVYNVLIR